MMNAIENIDPDVVFIEAREESYEQYIAAGDFSGGPFIMPFLEKRNQNYYEA